MEVRGNRKMNRSRWINIKKRFPQGNTYSLGGGGREGFCQTEVPIAMLLEEIDGY